MITSEKTKIVLVHGIFNTGHIMYFLKWILERNGFECFAPTLTPKDGRGGIERASENLKHQIEQRFDKDDRLNFIGFSLGGIVVRYYLQELQGNKRTDSLFTIASPHHGSYWAYFPYFTKGVKQLRPNSKFLLELEQGESKLKNLSLFSFYTPFDTSIVPSSSSNWRVAINKKFYSILHLTILFNFRLIRELIKQLDSQR
jgi:triacylglycerol lipase